MTTANQTRTPRQPFGIPMPMPMPAGGEQLYERALALADKVGEAYADAYRQISAAYAEAYQKLALRVGNLQGKLAGQQPSDWLSAISSGAPTTEQLSGVADRTFELGQNMTDVSRKVGLAFLDATEQATLAAADCCEQLGAASEVDLLKATSTTQAELARKVVQAGASTLREMVAETNGDAEAEADANGNVTSLH